MAVSYVGAGTAVYDNATSPLSVTNPTCQAGDLLVMFVGQKPSSANSGSVTTPSGWTLVGALTGAGGYGTTLGADTGNTNLRIYTKVAVAGDSAAAVSLAHATTNVLWALTLAFRSATGSFDTSGFASGSDTSSGTAVSATMGSNPGVTAGDMVAWAMCIPTDVTTPSQFSSHNITQTGVTYGTKTEVGELDSSTNNDIGGFIAYAPVSSGTGTANPVITATAGGTTTNVRGPVCMIRIREGAVTTITGSMAVTESGSDTIAASGTVTDPPRTGSMTVTESGVDVCAASGTVQISGSFGISESGADTCVSIGTVRVSGGMSVTEVGTDTLVSSGAVTDPPLTGSMAVIEVGADTIFSSGSARISGSFSITEIGSDFWSSSGTVRILGSASISEIGVDGLTCPGTVRVSGSLVASEVGADISAASGGPVVSGGLSITEPSTPDSVVSFGTVRIFGSLVVSDIGSDSFTASGTVSDPWIVGSLVVTESGPDILAASGQVRVQGSLSFSDAGVDTLVSTGQARVQGSLVISEIGIDGIAASGTIRVSGQFVISETGFDSTSSSGTVRVSGALTVTEQGSDTFEAISLKSFDILISLNLGHGFSVSGIKDSLVESTVEAFSSTISSGLVGAIRLVSIDLSSQIDIQAVATRSQSCEIGESANVMISFYHYTEGMEKFATYCEVRRRESSIAAAVLSQTPEARRRTMDFECIVKKTQ